MHTSLLVFTLVFFLAIQSSSADGTCKCVAGDAGRPLNAANNWLRRVMKRNELAEDACLKDECVPPCKCSLRAHQCLDTSRYPEGYTMEKDGTYVRVFCKDVPGSCIKPSNSTTPTPSVSITPEVTISSIVTPTVSQSPPPPSISPGPVEVPSVTPQF